MENKTLKWKFEVQKLNSKIHLNLNGKMKFQMAYALANPNFEFG